MTLEHQICEAVRAHLPGREVVAMQEKGTWVRRIVDVALDGGDHVLVKTEAPQPGWVGGGAG
jgi:hypothetical protein